MLLACCTILLSSFLLFQVQPMIGKLMLPWFGGVASVWTTCMLFFQAALLAGYWYAHLLTTKLSPRSRLLCHGMLVTFACSSLLLGTGMDLRPDSNNSPILFIVSFLALTIGLPYLCLSSTAPLVQGVLGGSQSSHKIYRLYSFSNAASLLALLSYPTFFEITFALSEQLSLWSYTFVAYSILATLFLISQLSIPIEQGSNEASSVEGTREAGQTLSWFLYSAVGCMILLSATNHICQNVASIPFLWVLPLGLYLLSFIVAFAKAKPYSRMLFTGVFFLSAASLVWLEQSGTPSLDMLLISSSVLIFSACMICHGELAREKPDTRKLTQYYFIMSFGSVCGSLFVTLVAPFIFGYYSEFILALLLCSFIALKSFRPHLNAHAFLILAISASLGCSLLYDRSHTSIASQRNFFGVLHIKEKNAEAKDFHFYRMFHGEVVHGLQFQAKEKQVVPTTYYGKESGIGKILSRYLPNKRLRIGGVGLGVGTIATYAKAGDTYRFYEINPAVIELAKEYFHFLPDSKAEVSYVVGDGRLALENEPESIFDVLLLDAFSGDSIPVHLLTSEAIAAYKHHLSPEGLLVFHITNTYIDLVPVIVAAADEHSMLTFYVKSQGEKVLGQVPSTYLILARPEHQEHLQTILDNAPIVKVAERDKQLWTDDFSNLLKAVRW